MAKVKNWFDKPLEERRKKLEALIADVVGSTVFHENFDEDEAWRLQQKIEMLYNVGGHYDDVKKYLLMWKKVCQEGK